jgi:hypothetical protein
MQNFENFGIVCNKQPHVIEYNMCVKHIYNSVKNDIN